MSIQYNELVYLALHQWKHFQHGCLTKRFKHQAWCTLLFTNVLQVLTLCKVGLVQRVGNIFNMAA